MDNDKQVYTKAWKWCAIRTKADSVRHGEKEMDKSGTSTNLDNSKTSKKKVDNDDEVVQKKEYKCENIGKSRQQQIKAEKGELRKAITHKNSSSLDILPGTSAASEIL